MAYGTIRQNSSDRRDPEPSENSARPGNGAGETIDAAGPGGSSVAGAGTASDHEAWHTAAWERLKAFYDKNFGLFLVFMAQFLSTVMTTTTRLLETSFDTKFHALQVIFVRMIATATIGSIYLGYNRVEGFPFGNPGIAKLGAIKSTLPVILRAAPAAAIAVGAVASQIARSDRNLVEDRLLGNENDAMLLGSPEGTRNTAKPPKPDSGEGSKNTRDTHDNPQE
ncbi:hypothetical protein GQ53DRAFT_845281 [Thozetella sp. PMI_491]|nr:hypothetical protein GQ53DRAFT_845281 [Thozetella sp. PMI_491]